MRPLPVIVDRVDARVRAIEEAAPGWPCTRGCDRCCHRLAEIPRITAAEWEALAAAVDAASAEDRARFAAAMASLSGAGPRSQRFVVCPFLAPADGVPRPGSCLVYAGRPIACRTYGYYVERGVVLGCEDVLAVAEEGPPVTWGNQVSIDAALDGADAVVENSAPSPASPTDALVENSAPSPASPTDALVENSAPSPRTSAFGPRRPLDVWWRDQPPSSVAKEPSS